MDEIAEARIDRRQFLKLGTLFALRLFMGEPIGTDRREIILQSDPFNPHFKAHAGPEGNVLVEAKGKPRSITTRLGKVTIELFDKATHTTSYLDPLAVKSNKFGEHPAEKVLRLKNKYKLKIPLNLENQLRDKNRRDDLCHKATFEYLPEKTTSLVVSEIADDGSIVTIMDSCPDEWNPPSEEYLTPKFFTATPDKIDRSSDIPRMAGFQFDSSVYGKSVNQKLKGILQADTSKTLYAKRWRAERFKEILKDKLAPDDLMVDEETAAVIGDNVFFSTSDGYPESSFGRVYKIDPEGSVSKVHNGPGRLLLAMPHPNDTNKILLSGEGYAKNDPRRQSIFERNLQTGKETVIDFPGESRDGQPELFGLAGKYDTQGNFIIIRYGFYDEGGGLWWVNKDDYGENKYLVGWDHMRTWNCLDSNDSPTAFSPSAPSDKRLVITAKEVDESSSMTVNRADFNGSGKNAIIKNAQRLGKMIGWNPKIRSWQPTGNKYTIQVEVPFDFDSYKSDSSQVIYEVGIV